MRISTVALLLMLLAGADARAAVAGPPARAPSTGKPQAPVALELAGQPALRAGVPAEVVLQVRTGVPAAAIRITLEGGAELQVLGWEPRVLPPQEPQQAGLVRVRLLPVAGGDQRLTALLELAVAGQQIARPVHLSLRVEGEASGAVVPEASRQRIRREPGGEAVISMEAETRIR